MTILKAFFDENTPIINPVTQSEDGSTLIPYGGRDADQMTVGGEQIAINVLRDQRLTYVQDFEGNTFTLFDGTRVTV